ncbi:helix-turn-helix domain-containing protein [Clostridium massiliamazoniense]|uniref:helix-turn-helix domain-containing protein n=1 Tax=Clostridium massiliamazoniense TaxID=1347366 RepID=UPI0006D7D952|nr:helix-turn-helix transcriptional regulator [Clostridium massiliamazoniense]
MNLKEIRNERGLKASYVAKKMGYSREYYSRLENRRTPLKKNHLIKLSEILNINIEDLLNLLILEED